MPLVDFHLAIVGELSVAMLAGGKLMSSILGKDKEHDEE